MTSGDIGVHEKGEGMAMQRPCGMESRDEGRLDGGQGAGSASHLRTDTMEIF